MFFPGLPELIIIGLLGLFFLAGLLAVIFVLSGRIFAALKKGTGESPRSQNENDSAIKKD